MARGKIGQSRTLRLLTVGGVVLWLLLQVVPRALAHAELREAVPAVGAAYRWNRPTEVRLRFTQSLEGADNAIIVTRQDFSTLPTEPAWLDPNDPTTLVVRLPNLAPDTYSVNWRTVSVDGHTLEGSYSFTILARWRLFVPWGSTVLLVLLALTLLIRRLKPSRRSR